MRKGKRLVTGAIATALAASAIGVGGAIPAQAEDASYMNKTLLEQSVLRAQPGKQLGSWTQNLYFDDVFSPSDLRPLVCPSRTKTSITLPKADSKGTVGYEAAQGATLSITIWQYKSADTAKSAAQKLAATSCPDSPKVTWETPGEYYAAEGGSDTSATTVAGNRALIGGYTFSADGINPGVNYAVRVVGNSVVRVDAVMGDATNKKVNSANRLVTKWIDRASNAVEKFSSMDPNAA